MGHSLYTWDTETLFGSNKCFLCALLNFAGLQIVFSVGVNLLVNTSFQCSQGLHVIDLEGQWQDCQ